MKRHRKCRSTNNGGKDERGLRLGLPRLAMVGLGLLVAAVLAACGGGSSGGGSSASGTSGGGSTSTGPTTSPNLYVPSLDSNVVQVYSLATNGTLASLGKTTLPANASAGSMTFDGSRNFVYFIDSTAQQVYGYAMNGTSGLTAIAGSPWATSVVSGGLGVPGNSAWLNVTNNGTGAMQTFAVNASTGALTAASTGTNPGAGHPCQAPRPAAGTSNVYCVTSTNILQVSINSTTGALTLANQYPFAGGTNNAVVPSTDGTKGIAVNLTNPSGGTNGCNNNGSVYIQPFTIAADGSLTLASSPQTFSNVYTDTTGDSGISFQRANPAQMWIFAGSGSSPTITPYTINYSTGALTAGTVLTDTGAAGCLSFMNVSLNGATAALWPNIPNIVQTASVSSSTGALTLGSSSVTTPNNINSVNSQYTSDSSIYVFVINAGTGTPGVIESFTVNPATGALTQVSSLATVNNPASGQFMNAAALAQ